MERTPQLALEPELGQIDVESRIGVGMDASTYGGEGDMSARKRDIRRLADASAPERRKWLARAAFFH
jgi:hypothetical protein